MAKTITIADEHSVHQPKQKITLELMGGCPYFQYIWIDDECYVLTKKRVAKIQKSR